MPIGLLRDNGSRGGFWLAAIAGFEVLGYFPAAETRPGRLKIGALEKSNLRFGRVWPGMAPPNTTPRVDQAPRLISSWAAATWMARFGPGLIISGFYAVDLLETPKIDEIARFLVRKSENYKCRRMRTLFQHRIPHI